MIPRVLSRTRTPRSAGPGPAAGRSGPRARPPAPSQHAARHAAPELGDVVVGDEPGFPAAHQHDPRHYRRHVLPQRGEVGQADRPLAEQVVTPPPPAVGQPHRVVPHAPLGRRPRRRGLTATAASAIALNESYTGGPETRETAPRSARLMVRAASWAREVTSTITARRTMPGRVAPSPIVVTPPSDM